MYEGASKCTDPIDYTFNGIITVAYTIYGVAELIGNQGEVFNTTPHRLTP